MKNLLIVSILLTLISGNALAGSEYDKCIKEEHVLKAKEAGYCSGLRQLLNPSGCYATQRVLKEYEAGKCRQIGLAENVDFSTQAVITEKKSAPVASVNKDGSSVNAGTAGSVATVSTVDRGTVKRSEAEVPQQKITLDQLKEENALLKAEIIRLKSENEQLIKAGH